ncbi:MAG: GNAT family N-acetyltransferase [SAR324 cluster bacterium]|nr:GNAT family N-acetyltransferase [SAR324 cluster bacterium]
MDLEVVTTFLEMTSPDQRQVHGKSINDAVLQKAEIPTPAINHFFFTNIGRPWKWYSRLHWKYEDWENWVTKKNVSTWIGYVQNSPFGYVEFDRQGNDTEIAFFGILPQYIGKGLGGWLLSEAIQKAWSFNTKRVWLHTCTLDHEFALKNYLSRGFTIFKEETAVEHIPEPDDLIWSTPDYYRSLNEKFSISV